jgi:phosphoribosylformylglycinamidine synthase
MLLKDTGSKRWLYEQYDHDIGTNTRFSSRDGGAAVVAVRPDWDGQSAAGIAISTACNERYCATQSRLGAAHAVMKCARMIAAAGGEPLAITDCLNFGSATDPVVMQQISDAVDGISEACQRIGIPVISGNVSLYNETDGRHIHPTPMIGMVGKLEDVRQSKPGRVTAERGYLYLVLPIDARPAFAASLTEKVLGHSIVRGAALPSISYEAEAESRQLMRQLASDDRVVACRDVGDGGPLTCIVKMLEDKALGARLNFARYGSTPVHYFAEVAGAYIVATAVEMNPTQELQMNRWIALGEFDQNAGRFVFDNHTVDKNELFEAFNQALSFVEN